VSPALAQLYRTVQSMFLAGRIDPGRGSLASNFLMDRSEANWAAEFARLAGRAGPCRTDAGIVATGALSGTFVWSCERGALNGALLLAPTNPPAIQSLRFTFAAR
jgi:serine-type D-Ala-D-Ala carboxypeptidase/endopeptidase